MMTATLSSPAACTACIGVFDSGVGGLSVLRALEGPRPGGARLFHAAYGDPPNRGGPPAKIEGADLDRAADGEVDLAALTQRAVDLDRLAGFG